MSKAPEKDCWLFLDCEVMTGELPENCPNHESCKYNALHTQNRYCFLPYEMWLPEMSQLFKVPTLQVDSYLQREAKEAGYAAAIDIFYDYQDSCLIVGYRNGCHVSIPDSALHLGFCHADPLPYKYKQLKSFGELTVTADSCDFIQSGWDTAVKLPYIFKFDIDMGKWYMEVRFDFLTSQYNDPESCGWSPPCLWYPRKTQNTSPVKDTYNNEIPF